MFEEVFLVLEGYKLLSFQESPVVENVKNVSKTSNRLRNKEIEEKSRYPFSRYGRRRVFLRFVRLITFRFGSSNAFKIRKIAFGSNQQSRREIVKRNIIR